MTKFSIETKLKVIKYILEENNSTLDAVEKFEVSKSLINKWINRYESGGENRLKMKSGTYNGYFKLKVINYMNENHMSFLETAIHFGIPSDSTIGKWEQIYLKEGPRALFQENRGRKKDMKSKENKLKKHEENIEKDLIKEIEFLRMENEYLKKLNALIQSKEELVKKIKYK